MSQLTPYDYKFEILVLEKELSWTDAYCGYTEPRFKRYQTLSHSELKKCLNHIQ